LAILAACASRQCIPKSGDLQLTLSAARSFRAGEPVILDAALRNTGAEAVTVSPVALGNLKILSLLRDGSPVRSRLTVAALDESLVSLHARVETVLPPGGTQRFVWQSDPDQGGQALEVAVDQGAAPTQITLYEVAQSGTYRLSAVFHPSLPRRGPNAFSGDSTVADVTFTLAP
jgi:hypothetical protein